MLRISTPRTITVMASNPNEFFAINSNTGEIYFQKFNLQSNIVTFNLPQPGGYNLTFNQPVEVLEQTELQYVPVLFELPKMDNPDPIPTPLTVVINPDLKGTPAQTIPGIRLIQFQPEFEIWPEPVKMFIYLHELGHFHYESCFDADLYALKNFFEMGYNISQAIYALIDFRNYSSVSMELFLNAYKYMEPLANYNYGTK